MIYMKIKKKHRRPKLRGGWGLRYKEMYGNHVMTAIFENPSLQRRDSVTKSTTLLTLSLRWRERFLTAGQAAKANFKSLCPNRTAHAVWGRRKPWIWHRNQEISKGLDKDFWNLNISGGRAIIGLDVRKEKLPVGPIFTKKKTSSGEKSRSECAALSLS